jgi:hypothetical protein
VKLSSTNCHGNPQRESKVVLGGYTERHADRQTDRHGEANKCIFSMPKIRQEIKMKLKEP